MIHNYTEKAQKMTKWFYMCDCSDNLLYQIEIIAETLFRRIFEYNYTQQPLAKKWFHVFQAHIVTDTTLFWIVKHAQMALYDLTIRYKPIGITARTARYHCAYKLLVIFANRTILMVRRMAFIWNAYSICIITSFIYHLT